MTYRYDENEQTFVLDAIDDPVIADAETQMTSLAPLKGFHAWRPGILSQRIDPIANSFPNIAGK